MRFLLGILAGLLIALFTPPVVALTGALDVSATAEPPDWEQWLLETTRTRSIQVRAREVDVPPLDDPELLALGAAEYAHMCVICHGAPDTERGVIGQGMHPLPPDLSATARDWTDAELYQIIAEGIRLAGMPAFGPTHDERALWALVAFVRELPTMTPEAYLEWMATPRPPDAHHHP